MRCIDVDLVMFDLDGTLVDSLPDLADCVDRMLVAEGLPSAGAARVREWLGNGITKLVERALADRAGGVVTAERRARAEQTFRQLYAEDPSAHSRCFDGAEAILRWLQQHGIHRVCITNKDESLARELLATLGLADLLDRVIGGDTLERCKPDPEPLLAAMRHYGATAARSLMVGDSINDVHAARAAGVAVVCVDYGYNHGEPIAAARPDRIIGHLDDLRRLIQPSAENA